MQVLKHFFTRNFSTKSNGPTSDTEAFETLSELTCIATCLNTVAELVPYYSPLRERGFTDSAGALAKWERGIKPLNFRPKSPENG